GVVDVGRLGYDRDGPAAPQSAPRRLGRGRRVSFRLGLRVAPLDLGLSLARALVLVAPSHASPPSSAIARRIRRRTNEKPMSTAAENPNAKATERHGAKPSPGTEMAASDT